MPPSTTIAATCCWGSAPSKEAVKDFDRALLLAPGYAAAYSNRAGTYMKLGQVDRAIADYSKAIELTPNSAAALSGRGRAHLAADRPHGAIRDFTRAVTLDTRFSAAYRSRAEAKMTIERYEEAIEDFSRAIAFEPRNAEIYALRGAAYVDADNAASGIKDFAKAIELGPNTASFYATRGLAYAKAEAYEDALNDFRPRHRARAAPPQDLCLPCLDVPSAAAGRVGTEGCRAGIEARREERGGLLGARRDQRGARARGAGRGGPAQGVRPRPPPQGCFPGARASGGQHARVTEAEVAEAGLDRWHVFRKGRQFIATNEEFPRLTINLEMMGKGQPRILEWEVKKPPFAGIAVLRFYSGTVHGAKGPEEVEQTAIIDLQSNTVVSVAVQRQGEKQAQWTWEDGKLIVATADGLTDEFQLRQGKPKEPAAASRKPKRTEPRKPRTLFELLFGL